MRLSIDLDTFAVSDYTGSAVQALSARRGDSFPVHVRFTQGGVGRELPNAATGRLAIKSAQNYAGPLVAGSATWRKVGYGAAAYYVFQLGLNTEPLSTIFASGEVAQASFVIEIEWTHRGVRSTSRAVTFTVENDFIKGSEESPDMVPDSKATQAEAVAGTENGRWMTPLRTFQAVAAWVTQNLSWSTLTGKPSTFPPAAHTHTASQITDFSAAVVAAAPPTTNASLLTSGTLADARLSAGVATSLGKADSALQSSALTPYRTASAQDTIDAGKATAAQGAKADSALQPGAAINDISGLQTALDGTETLLNNLRDPSKELADWTVQRAFALWDDSHESRALQFTGYDVNASVLMRYDYHAPFVAHLNLATTTDVSVVNNKVDNETYYRGLAISNLQTAVDALTPSDIGALGLSESSYIVAKPGDSLAAKYTAAKALTPNGAAKSATNRASLIIFPGSYTISAELAIDAEFVDVLGLGAQTRTPAVFIAGNTLNVSADDVRVSGISTGTQSFKITGNLPLQVFENCAGGASSFGSDMGSPASGTFTDCTGGALSFGGYFAASGTFTNCTAGESSFGGDAHGAFGVFTNCSGGTFSFGGGGPASGTFTNCTSGDRSFGGEGTASGTFTNCTGGYNSFGGGGGIASGTFTNCTGGYSSFGGDGTASGTFTDCTGGDFSFGGINTASGTFTNCTGGYNSFGGEGTASGTFTNCTGGYNSFGGAASGTFTNCTGGDRSFGGNGGTASGTFTDCTGGDYSFGGGGTASGTFTDCTGGDYSFGGGGTASGKFIECRLTAGTYESLTAPATGKAIMVNCLDGDGNINSGQAPL